MELLALGKPIKKPPRSDERDGELFCGTEPKTIAKYARYAQVGGGWVTLAKVDYDNATMQSFTSSSWGSATYDLDEFRISGVSIYALKTGVYAVMNADGSYAFNNYTAGQLIKTISGTESGMFVFCHE